MSKLTFKNNAIHKPITEKQYEELCNELLVVLNKMADPDIFDADFIGAIFANAIHSVDMKGGWTTKSKILDVMIDLIAKRLSFQISEGIRHKKEAEKKQNDETSTDELPKATTENVEATSH